MLSPLPIPPAGEPLLSPTHQRVLSSLVLLLEDRLTALQALLGPHPPGIAQVWADDLSTAEHAGLTATAEAFRAAQLWEILGDAPAAKFSGYGALPPTLAPDWDARVQRLTALANQLLAQANAPDSATTPA